jgi:hypothetical protein
MTCDLHEVQAAGITLKSLLYVRYRTYGDGFLNYDLINNQ